MRECHPRKAARALFYTRQCCNLTKKKDTDVAGWLSCSSCDGDIPILKVKMTRLAVPAKNVGTGTANPPSDHRVK